MSRRWLSAVAGLAAAAAMAGTAFATVPRVQHPTSVTTATPVLSVPVRDLPRTDIPGITQRIVGHRHLTQQQLAQLQHKLLDWRQLQHTNTSGKRPVPAKRLTPVGGQRPVQYKDLQTQVNPGPNSFTTNISFPGLGVSDTPPDAIGCAPPDTNAAVGSGYVVEIVNLCTMSPGVGVFKVWDTSGNVVQGATALGGLWSTSDCQNGGGDNVVNYDQFANRWILSQFNSSYTGICIAVSTSSDPTGTYNLYDVVMDSAAFVDYPKVGVWPVNDTNQDAYLISGNEFYAACGNCVVYTAVQRAAMLSGSTATVINIVGPPYLTGLDFSALPSDVDGMTLPPTDDPGMFVDYISPWYYGGSTYALEMWQMTPDFGNPSNTTLTGPTAINVDSFNDGDNSCAPQPSPGECLPVLGDRLMFRLAYRNGNANTSDQTLVVNHAVTTNGTSAPIGIDWYQLDAPSGSTSAADWAINQQGVFAPADNASRFMGSIAQDHMGNIGMGYTISDGSSIDPSVAVTGQDYGTGGGVMDAGEATLIAGTGVQQSTGRWGDYSSIMVDPSDDCTFWTAQEYISSTGSFNWSTGIGSFKFDNCSIGPTGTLSGTITDANSGNPINNATVTLSPGGASGNSGNDNTGTYTVTTAPGTYTAAATAFGYQESDATVNITDGGNTTQDFALTPSPQGTLHGRVSDSGHGYPLYAEVVVKYNGSTVADVWTSTDTGAYSVQLPTGNSYDITVTPYFSGYTAGTATVTLTGNQQEMFSLDPDSSCTAPGYQFSGGLAEDFEGTFPPDGWTVANDYSGAYTVWARNDNVSCTSEGNYTGGSGYTAVADSNYAGDYCGDYGSYDTSLISPPVDVTALGGTTAMWKENYVPISDSLDFDISTDGGNTWTTIQSMPSCGTLYGLPGCDESVDIGAYLPGSGTFQLRWRYFDLTSGWDWYAQVDSVLLGATCTAIPGGLVQGTALDANNGNQLTGVTVTDENGNSTQTVSANGSNGFVMFEPSGSHTLTATMNNYQDNVKTVSVSNGKINATFFFMRAGMMQPSPTSFNVNVPVNTIMNVLLSVKNVGTAPVDAQVTSIDAPPAQPSTGHGAPPLGVHCQTRVSPASLLIGSSGDCGIGNDAPGRKSNDSVWTQIADYPIPVADNCMATDESSGLTYSFSGISNGATTASSYVYDPSADSWSAIASMPAGLEKPACAFINGLAYVTAGWDSLGNSNQTTYIYDPSTDSWTTGASDPGTQAGGAEAAVLNGMMYVIGGCYDGGCSTTNVVEVYDPSSDSWSSAANYPHDVSWQSCGGIGSELYCAGGYGAGSYYGDAQAYDPGTDTWSAVASLPNNSYGCNDLWGGAGIGANGSLLVQDGVTCSGFDIINEGFAYDPGSDSWSSLPNALVADYRMGSSCGFYAVGGSPFNGSTFGELLSGYDQCTVGTVPWLSFDPASGTIPVGKTAHVTMTIDGTGQTAGTSETVQVRLTGNTPYGSITIPLTVNWQ